MTNGFTSPFSVMEDITGTQWGPGDGPNRTIKSWLDFIGSDYPEMKAYCSSASHLEYFEWCGLTVAYCMAKAGIKPVFGRRDIDHFLWANAWKEWGDVVHTPQKGDVVVFDWGGGHQHVTIFERDLGNGYWACRGGNQTHEVKISRFPRSACSGVRRASVAVPVGAPAEIAVPAEARAEVAVPAAAPSSFSGAGTPLTKAGLEKVCEKLGVGPAEFWALIFTETDPPHGGFLKEKRPQILYERHIFHRLTRGRFDSVNSNISNSSPGGYGAGGAHQYDRLSIAMSLDETAALESASWGIGQVLGQNYREAGFSSPQELVAQHFASEDAQLLAVANEIIADGAAHALATHDWARFARIYNGPTYWKNHYDQVIRSWYQKFSAGAMPDLRVRSAQMYLMYLRHDPGEIDGSWGKRTRSAMNEFQSAKGMPITEELDDATFEAIKAAGEAVPGAGLAASAAAAPKAVPVEKFEATFAPPLAAVPVPVAAEAMPVSFAVPAQLQTVPLQALRLGSQGPLVVAWQHFLQTQLSGDGVEVGEATGLYDDRTAEATKAFQAKHGLEVDGVAGRQTLLKAMALGFELIEEPAGDKSGSNFPPRPAFPPLVSTAQRQAIFGAFQFVPAPLPDNREHIRILGNWQAENIVNVPIPQLRRALGSRARAAIPFHKLAAEQLKGLWQAWEDADLLDRILTFDGSFEPRFVRGSRSSLSNHSFGTAFDINADFNPYNTRPRLFGEKGSTRELVPIANQWGFYWGGHFRTRPDGMHFEIAVLQQGAIPSAT
jgi:peptidoglycan hydrolase-like protein with peptidoglycan-binding domain